MKKIERKRLGAFFKEKLERARYTRKLTMNIKLFRNSPNLKWFNLR